MTNPHEYRADAEWTRAEGEDFARQRYSRRHTLRFDGGAVIMASSSPSVVPLPWSDAAAVDPEEAFVAALSSCHLLWFLSLAAKAGWRVARYSDSASGLMTPDARGKLWVSRVTLRPAVVFDGERRPTRQEVMALHHEAHEECFIANSVRSEVLCEPVFS
jgi:organic hydroperoxide reductase OsmC/OhrA